MHCNCYCFIKLNEELIKLLKERTFFYKRETLTELKRFEGENELKKKRRMTMCHIYK